ncbi:hypothetical protein QT06_C0001G0134 [archaeon GW2011_AR15]|nr:hypothetical protein QT06_C0001G0134 [archaeon GW2011_AR15]MBS3104062.1 hypothetical protein [Candidatus Woesearchaeota archaeon]
MVIDKEKSHFKAPTTKIDKLIKEWREFVNSCKAGYELSFYDYKNDLDIRLLIQKIIDSNTKKSEKIRRQIQFEDTEFRELLVNINACIYPKNTETQFDESKRDKYFWYWGIIKNARGELLKDLESEKRFEYYS